MLWWTLRQLKSDDWQRRQAAIATLSRSRNSRVVQPLIACLSDSDWGVQEAAAAALGQSYPLTEEFEETSQLNGKAYTVQYFERAIFEHHPENAGSPYEVLLSQLGKYQLDARYPNGLAAAAPIPGPSPSVQPALSPPASPSSGEGLAIYVGEKLSSGYDLGVDTSGRKQDWVKDLRGAMQLSYPTDQAWGAGFITVGHPAPLGQRQGRDFSKYQTLAIDLKGAQGGEALSVGIKDQSDEDDGKETKIPVTLSNSWQTCWFPLAHFTTADLAHLYIPAEFVFEPGVPAETVYFRNVRYLGNQWRVWFVGNDPAPKKLYCKKQNLGAILFK